jgi:hypothetical protein
MTKPIEYKRSSLAIRTPGSFLSGIKSPDKEKI